MEYEGEKVSDIKIAYIGGGSKGWAWNLMVDLAVEPQLSGTIYLYDIDYNAAKANEIIGNDLSQREDVVGKWVYKACKTIKEALLCADFIVISILPGTFDEMDSDVHLPEKYGIYQAVGDTVGPGGLIRALRTVDMYILIAESIKKYSPNAWVINYTNPMTVCTRTLYKVFPEIKAFGCCHEVFGTQKILSQMLADMNGIKDVKRRDIKVNVLGINHFTWFDKASYKGIDLFPIYKDFVDKYYDTGFINEENEDDEVHESINYFKSTNRVKFDLFRRYGIIAAAGDRHLAEFMPPWYLKDPDTVKKWMFGLTPVKWRKEHKVKLDEKSKRLINKEEAIKLDNSGEEGVMQIKALLGLGQLVSNVNIPNKGQAIGLPLEVVVESNAIFDRDSIKPIIAGKLPDNVQALVMKHVMNQEMIVEAGIRKDKALAFNAFTNDNLVNIDIEIAEELFEQMLRNTKEYLPGWDIS